MKPKALWKFWGGGGGVEAHFSDQPYIKKNLYKLFMQIFLSRFLLHIMLVVDCKTTSFQPIVYRTKDNFAEIDKKN